MSFTWYFPFALSKCCSKFTTLFKGPYDSSGMLLTEEYTLRMGIK